MEEIKKILDEQKHICQTEFDKRSKLIDGVWYVACEDVLNAPYPKQLLIHSIVSTFKCDCGCTNHYKNEIHDSIMCADCGTIYTNV